MRQDPVFVCAGCGRGFVRHPGCKIDPFPVWSVGIKETDPRSDGPCLGAVTATYRSILIRNLDDAENSRKDR
jgi:hypothetical protein